MIKTILPISLCVGIFFIMSCLKPKEPNAKICPEEPLVIKVNDTLILENCSEHYESQLWELPNGTTSSQNSIVLHNLLPGNYEIILKVKNNDYANDYISTRKLQVITP